MTWLYLPRETITEPETDACSASPFALALAGSTLGSPSPSPDIVLWTMSNGKPSPQPLSWRGWKTRPWIGIATGGVLTLFIAAPPNGSSVWVRVVDEGSGAVFEQEITADLPANTQFMPPRLFLNTGATAAAVAYDCSGVYVETDF